MKYFIDLDEFFEEYEASCGEPLSAEERKIAKIYAETLNRLHAEGFKQILKELLDEWRAENDREV